MFALFWDHFLQPFEENPSFLCNLLLIHAFFSLPFAFLSRSFDEIRVLFCNHLKKLPIFFCEQLIKLIPPPWLFVEICNFSFNVWIFGQDWIKFLKFSGQNHPCEKWQKIQKKAGNHWFDEKSYNLSTFWCKLKKKKKNVIFAQIGTANIFLHSYAQNLKPRMNVTLSRKWWQLSCASIITRQTYPLKGKLIKMF